jgi:hypothetical protein
MSRAQDWAYYIPKLADQARDRGKLLMMEEWGVGTYSQDNVATQAIVFNDAGVPWVKPLKLSLLPKFEPC